MLHQFTTFYIVLQYFTVKPTADENGTKYFAFLPL